MKFSQFLLVRCDAVFETNKNWKTTNRLNTSMKTLFIFVVDFDNRLNDSFRLTTILFLFRFCCYLLMSIFNQQFYFTFSFSFFQWHIADSIIGIRSNYSANDQIVKPDTNLSNLSTTIGSSAVSMGVDNAPHRTQNSSIAKSPQKKAQPDAINVHVIDTTNTVPANGQTNNATPTITVTPTPDDADKIIDGMLDRISHDLDYLLNRTCEIPPAPPPPTATVPPVIHSHPNLSVREVILEEEAEDS